MDGISFYNRGKEKQALKSFRKCLKEGKNHPGIYYYAGVIRYNQNDFIKAIYNFNQGFGYPEKGFNGYFYLGRIYQKQKKYERAIDAYRQYIKKTALKLGKQKAQNYIKYCQSKLSKNEKKVSLQIVKKIKKISTRKIKEVSLLWNQGFTHFCIPKNTETRVSYKSLNEAGDLVLKGEYVEALNILERVKYKLSHSPISQYASANLVNLYFHLGQNNKAIQEGTFFVNSYPKGGLSAFVNLILAKIYLSQNSNLKASIEINQLKELDAGGAIDTKLIDLLDIILISREGTVDEWLNLEKKMDEFSAKDGFILWQLSKLYQERKDSKKSLAYLTEGIKMLCENNLNFCSSLQLDLYNLQYSQGKLDLAFKGYIGFLERKISTQDSVWGLFQIANIFYLQKKYKKSVLYYRRLIDQYPQEYWVTQAKFRLEDAIWRLEHQ